MASEGQFWVALWGAGLATVLAGIKIWEIWRERVRLYTSYSFTSDPYIGSSITVFNTSKVPALFSYWDVVAAKKAGRKDVRTVAEPDGIDGGGHVTIPAHSARKFEFHEMDHFDWPKPVDTKETLFIRLYRADSRKTVWLPVYRPEKQ